MPRHLDRPLPKVGEKFSKKFRGETYVLEVVENNGRIAYALNGKNYQTPSAAAKAVTQSEINGWRFWKIDH